MDSDFVNIGFIISSCGCLCCLVSAVLGTVVGLFTFGLGFGLYIGIPAGILICFAGFVINQFLGLRKFGRLRNFDLYLQEQEMEDDTSTAKIKINKNLFEIDFEDIKTISILGEGGSDSIVFKSLWKGQTCAFKCFKTRELCNSQDNFNSFEREVGVMASISHPNIVNFYGASCKIPRVGILMEYCPNGELLHFILKYKRDYGISYPLQEKIQLFVGITSSLSYIHERNIIHRDLKCENVLIGEGNVPKLMDFGLSRIFERLDDSQKTKRVGTAYYMAPEILKSSDYGPKCDIFSLSVMMFMVVTEMKNPYEGKTDESFAVEFKVANDPQFRPNLELVDEGWMREIISRCWSHEVDERYSSEELVEILMARRKEMADGIAPTLQVPVAKKIVEVTTTTKKEEIDVGDSEDFGNSQIVEEHQKLKKENEELRSENEELKENMKRLQEKLSQYEKKEEEEENEEVV